MNVFNYGGAFIECEDNHCLAGNSLHTFESVIDAIEAWNTRTSAEHTCGEWRGWENPDPSAFHDDDRELWCQHCDIELDEGWSYCPSCGAKVVNKVIDEYAEVDE